MWCLPLTFFTASGAAFVLHGDDECRFGAYHIVRFQKTRPMLNTKCLVCSAIQTYLAMIGVPLLGISFVSVVVVSVATLVKLVRSKSANVHKSEFA